MSLIFRNVVALPKRFIADCRGVTSILTALSLTGMLGCAGLATEVGLWYVKQSSMQGAADSAAYSAAIALAAGENSSLFQTEAQAVAGTYGFVNGSGGTTVTVNNPPASGPNTSQSSAIEVIISQPQNSYDRPALSQHRTHHSSACRGGGWCQWERLRARARYGKRDRRRRIGRCQAES